MEGDGAEAVVEEGGVRELRGDDDTWVWILLDRDWDKAEEETRVCGGFKGDDNCA